VVLGRGIGRTQEMTEVAFPATHCGVGYIALKEIKAWDIVS
jgi:hypothetical protein